MTQLVRYEAMRAAITVCHSVDEIKDLHDKALALELYTRQARDLEAERKASDIRLRAERRAGELLRDLARATPQTAKVIGMTVKRNIVSNGETRFPKASEYASTLERSGISRQTAGRWQELAKIPEPDFEAALADPVAKPSTTRLIQQIRDPVPQLDDRARTLWGICWAFERDNHAAINLEAATTAMLPTMRADAMRLVPQIIQFFNKFAKVLSHEHV